MTTWIQVMTFVRELDDQRRAGRQLSGNDAERLVGMLLDFHERAVEAVPESSQAGQRRAT